MDILFLSHCVPNPPNKGEKIRAFRELCYLADRYRVHLVAFGQTALDAAFARELSKRCASVYCQPLSKRLALARAAADFVRGRSLTMSYFASEAIHRHIAALSKTVPLAATVAYTGVMSQFAPPGVPLLVDLVDVDSEKWFEYATRRWPRVLYSIEAKRLRREEVALADRSRLLLSTQAERALFGKFAAGVDIRCFTNGVDTEYFDPDQCTVPAEWKGRRYLTFVGTMDYYPNMEGVCWFANHVHPRLRELDARMEFVIVGRNPSYAVRRLAHLPGVTVTGDVPDVRPYLLGSLAVVAPLQIARGIQNKVLEGLSMGKSVLASASICSTFMPEAPRGVIRCESAKDFITSALEIRDRRGMPDPAIRSQVQQRFNWDESLKVLEEELQMLVGARQ